jgi:hypothetical protein
MISLPADREMRSKRDGDFDRDLEEENPADL